MGYGKFQLSKGDGFQKAVGMWRIADMVATFDLDCEGTYELAYESPGVDGWDDIVEFGYKGNGSTVRHWQVKAQVTNLNLADLKGYLEKALSVRQNLAAYGVNPVAPDHRTFHFGLPGLALSFLRNGGKRAADLLAVDALAKLCEALDLDGGDARIQISGNSGDNLPANRKEWLDIIAGWMGGYPEAATLLSRVSVRGIGGAEELETFAKRQLGSIWENADEVYSHLMRVASETEPESRFRASDAHHALKSFRRKLALCTPSAPGASRL